MHGMRKAKSSRPSTAARSAGKSKAKRAVACAKITAFGEAIRARRRELDLTQDEVAVRMEISAPYVGHLESGKRHPSDKIIAKLAAVLGLDNRELFFLANPHAEALIAGPVSDESSSWEQFKSNEKLQRIHSITNDEMQVLSHVALMGDIQSPRDLIHILATIRHVVGR